MPCFPQYLMIAMFEGLCHLTVCPCVSVFAASALTRNRSGAELVDLEEIYEQGVRIFTDDGDCLEDESKTTSLLEGAALFHQPRRGLPTPGLHFEAAQLVHGLWRQA